MAKQPLRAGFSSGTTFAVIIIFLALIGFTVTGPLLLAKLLGNAPSAGQPPSVPYLVLFLVLMGLWNGAGASRSQGQDDSLPRVLQSSLTAGLVTGMLVAALSLVFSSLLERGVDPRAHLAMVSPPAMRFFLFGQPGLTAFFYHLLLQVAAALLGGLLAFGLRRASLGQRLRAGWRSLTGSAMEPLRGLLRTPLALYALFALVALVLFFLPRQWGSYWNYIIGTVGIYVILGLGLNIIVGLAGQLVLGYVAFFAIGAYTTALLTAPAPHALFVNL
jgi:hypothetical protein